MVEEECKNNCDGYKSRFSTVGVLFDYDEFERWYATMQVWTSNDRWQTAQSSAM